MVQYDRKLIISAPKGNLPYASLLTLNAAGYSTSKSLDIGGTELQLNLDGVRIKNDVAIARLIAQSSGKDVLTGSNIFEKAHIDEVSTLCEQAISGFLLAEEVLKAQTLSKSGTLFEGRFTVADFALFALITKDEQLQKQYSGLFSAVLKNPALFEAHDMVGIFQGVKPEGAKAAKAPAVGKPKEKQKDEGKFVELPGAEKGKVVVRFPPEASGYLHIGHAKAALLNQYYQQAFDGKLIMRFDDTNPAKENAHFEQVIKEDLAMLQIVPDVWTHSSDHFDTMLGLCEKLLREGKAFVDDTDTETMRKEREDRVESRNRSTSPEVNLALWDEMKKGTARGQQCCVRIKMDMQSNNGAMRDPTIYRCKVEEHVRTGAKYKVYPTYDFACPIVDSVEGVTHALRTTEYHDRDDQYYFICDALGLRKPYIWEYARLNMTNTVMSKRKLTWFVEENIVEGWDDPRFPTVRGVLRRGLTVEGLKQFIVAQGGSRSVVTMEWDKIWAFNKKVVDPIAPRYTALDKTQPLVTVHIEPRIPNAEAKAALHPKNADVGEKTIYQTSKILVEQIDAKEMKVGDTVTFVNWGNLKIVSVDKKDDLVLKIVAKLDLENKDYKKTMKVTWIGDVPQPTTIPVVGVDYDHIISKAIIGKEEDWKNFINYESIHYTQMIGEPALRNVKKGDIIQIQRKGFYICDHAYVEKSAFTGVETPLLLIAIPDGKEKEQPTATASNKAKSSQTTAAAAASVGGGALALYNALESQGGIVRDLKAKDAKSQATKDAISKLLELKKKYKENTGQEYKAGSPPAAAPAPSSLPASDALSLYNKLEEQGNKVRVLKGKDPKGDDTKMAIQELLSFKKQYKEVTGQEYKTGSPPAASSPAPPPAPSSIAPSDSEALAQYNALEAQGTVVRELKGKNPKSQETKDAIAKLLCLKTQYKETTGQDYKSGSPPAAAANASASTPAADPDPSALYKQIEDQGNVVRDLKNKDAKSQATKDAIAKLLELKKQYKAKTGQEYKPGAAPVTPVAAATPSGVSVEEGLAKEIETQGNLVRDLKGKDAKSQATKDAISKLLELKKQYKEKTGQEYKPSTAPVSAAAPSGDSVEETLTKQIEAQGNLVRELKGKDAKSAETTGAIAKLLELKKSYKEKTGKDFQPAGGNQQQKAKKGKDEKPKLPKQSEPKKEDKGDGKKQTKLGIETKKDENYSEWYSQVITKAEMIEYYDVSGCYVLRPWSFAIWEVIKKWFDIRIKRLGVKNCYFPMFVSQSALEREKEHIADFAPEVAWVTRAGSSEMAEPIAIRPTSETVMYPSYKKWVQSHRDLPIKLNQWCNVVRWEFKHPTPFLRTREFLWQEGHTAYANPEDAEKEVFQILDLYAGIYEELLAVPVIKGRKSEKEKFAGGKFTTTVEAYIPVNGRGVQGATSHHLGQNFSKMFDIAFEDPSGNGQKALAWQNSWGLTTRTIGAMVMVHGDDNGLVLPPRVAAIQVVVMPVGITASTSEADRKKLSDAASDVVSKLLKKDLRAEGDLRDNYSPGWKFNHWELKGVPIRLEIGPKDLAAGQVTAVLRYSGEKLAIPISDVESKVVELLDRIHKDMFDRVKAVRDAHMKICDDFGEFKKLLDEKFILLAAFCGRPDCEENVKRDSTREDGQDGAQMGAKTLCLPLEQPAEPLPAKCFHPDCSEKPIAYALFGRSY